MTKNAIPACPVCSMENTYIDGDNLICPDCSYQWTAKATKEEAEESRVHKDAHGNILNDSDHDIDCKVDGQSMLLKSEFMKKS